MKSFFKLISGFFADQDGNGSRKAMVLYISMYFMYLQLKASIDGKPVNEYMLGANMIIILFCLGAITAEWITKNYNPGDKPADKLPTT